jgi:predicted kinase
MRKNKEVKLCIGIPASGKSTWGKEFVTKNIAKWVRICRDDYRYMLKNIGWCDFDVEKMITKLVQDAIVTALNSGFNVLVDQTNVKEKYLNEFINFLEDKADVTFQIFDIDLKTALERDANRDRSVGEDVVKRMYKDYKNLFDSNFDFSTRKKKTRIESASILVRDENLPNAVVVDMDGTLTHMRKRGPFDWNRVDEDDCDEIVRETVKVYKNSGYEIIILTGRDGTALEKTKEWLEFYDVPYDHIFIRKAGDFRKDSVIKKEIYENELKGKFNILHSIDDRQQVTDMWRSMGIKCYQVEKGNF